MQLTTLRFPIPHSNQILMIQPQVLETFLANRQGDEDLESGGLLFATFQLPIISLELATEPARTDKRGRWAFEIDGTHARKVIRSQFRAGRHFLGEWHTHPECDPSPSGTDRRSIRSLFEKSQHELNALVMIIVGSNPHKLSLWVSLHNNTTETLLNQL